MFCECFAVQPPNVKLRYGRRMGLSLWPVSQTPLRSSLRSLAIDQLANVDDLKRISVLAVFSYLPEEKDVDIKENFEFPIEVFRSAFHSDGFNQPINLGIDKGFCFVLAGKDSNDLCRSRCISFVQIVRMRALLGDKVSRSQPLFELFPCLAKFALRFPLMPPPLTETSFIPFHHKYELFEKKEDTPCVLRNDQAERWKKHMTNATDAIFIGSSQAATNETVLKQSGITHIVNCTAHVSASATGFIAKNLCMQEDSTDSLLSTVFSTTVFIDDAVTNNGKVLVCCAEGRAFSPVIVIAYLILKEKIDYQTIYKRLKRKRRVITINPTFASQLIELAELVGAAPPKTSSFAINKRITFEIRQKGRVCKAVPLSASQTIPRKNADRCFITIDYTNVGSLSKRDNKPPATLSLNIGPGSRKELQNSATRFVDQLAQCLRVADSNGNSLSNIRVFASPNWRELPPEALQIPNSETIYVVIDGIAWRVIVGSDVPEHTDINQQLRRCCGAVNLATPLVFDVIDLADE